MDFTYNTPQAPPPIDSGLFGATPTEPHSEPPRGTEREEQAQADATRIEHMAKRLPPPTTAQEFAAFHAENPHVYELLVRVARDSNNRGKRRTMKGLFEFIRGLDVQPTNGKPWKLDNTFTPYYSRLIMANCEDLRGYFEVRRSKGDA